MSIVQNMITIIGGSNIDLYGHQGNDHVSGQADAGHYDDSTPGRITHHAGGVGRNIAENLGRLGCNPQLITAFGSDAHADLMMHVLKDANVDISHSIQLEASRSDTYLAIYDKDGHLITAVSDMTLIEGMRPEQVTPVLDDIRGDDFIVMDGNLDNAVIEAVFAHKETDRNRGRADDARVCGARICIDGVSTHKVVKFKPYLAQINVLKCNRQEAAALTGLPQEALGFDHARALRDEGVETVIMSDSADGFLIGSDAGYETFEATLAKDIVNVSGAGDALMAAIIFGLSQKMDVMASGGFASRLAALTLSHQGPVHPEPDRAMKLED